MNGYTHKRHNKTFKLLTQNARKLSTNGKHIEVEEALRGKQWT